MQGIRKATEEKNSFWPAPAEVRDLGIWSYVGLGAMAVMIEEAARRQRDQTIRYSTLLLSTCALGA